MAMTLKRLRNPLFTVPLMFLVTVGLITGVASSGLSPLRKATAPHEQNIVRWEVAHFLDKWVRRFTDTVFFWGAADQQERETAITTFFTLGQELDAAARDLDRSLAAGPGSNDAANAQDRVSAIRDQREDLQPLVEEVLEGAISQALDDLGISGKLGPLRWPPVDFTFEENGLVLVRSPRDAIVRQDDVLLRPDVPLLEQTALEDAVESTGDNIAALVIRIGGVATYPAQVSPHLSLHGTLELAAHEWLHHWLFFRPLGRAWFAGGELTSVNETAANLFAQEAGDRALTILTGQIVDRPPWTPPTLASREEPSPGVFDFQREMRATRVELERLLGSGDVPAAEDYLEQRRLAFVANGFNIRKLNTAWFAFHGTYGDSPGSISPIEAQLRAVRASAGSLAGFLGAISGISQEGDLERIAIEAGWEHSTESS